VQYKGKKIWVTGASSGIGEALAYEFARQGATLILSARRIEKLEEVKNKCLSLTGTCIISPMDLAEPDTIKKSVEHVMKQFSSIDILINNGGISQRSFIIETPVDIDRKIMEVNYFGSVLLTKLLLPFMIKNGGGHIVAISSIVGKFGFPLRSAYSASKHAMHGFYESLKTELKKENIRVTIVLPGRVVTNISYNAITKNGSLHGKMDDGQKAGIDTEICAKKILNGIKKRKFEILIGGKEILMVHLRKYFPKIFFNIASRIKPT